MISPERFQRIRDSYGHYASWAVWADEGQEPKENKDFEEKVSGKMMKYLRANRDFEEENIRILKTEVEALGASSPVLIAFGKDAEKLRARGQLRKAWCTASTYCQHR